MNEKIQELAKQLQEECRSEVVSLLCSIQKEGSAKMLVNGNLPEIGLLLALQERNLNNQIPINVGILREVADLSLKEVEIEDKKNSGHTFVVDDPKDIPEILKSIIRGDYV